MMDWDAPSCPSCSGRGRIAYVGRTSWIETSCSDCHGTGNREDPRPGPRYNAGGFRIREEGEDYDEAVHGPRPPLSEHPAVRKSGLCPMCLGSGVVISEKLIEAHCPACTRL
ncbi:hypothetical protein [Actinomadura rubrisoli]|uniref:Uncharacterized protein n=1 Tax=Actinomadura rubrisoli TaxID=2530368 RepID=A0A4R5B8Y5_9ACTN|nr:hypothetical protein [Actinomadura rubrisoli]TDD80174.1 hypothetical protein E1298_26415 [Actinomadura rubrisoli]